MEEFHNNSIVWNVLHEFLEIISVLIEPWYTSKKLDLKPYKSTETTLYIAQNNLINLIYSNFDSFWRQFKYLKFSF